MILGDIDIFLSCTVYTVINQNEDKTVKRVLLFYVLQFSLIFFVLTILRLFTSLSYRITKIPIVLDY